MTDPVTQRDLSAADYEWLLKVTLAKRAGCVEDLIVLRRRRVRALSLIAALDVTIAELEDKRAAADATLAELGFTPEVPSA